MLELATADSRPIEKNRERLRRLISEKALSSGGSYRLASGMSSAFYFDMKTVACDPEGSRLIADLILDTLKNEDVNYVGGMEAGAITIVIGVVQRSFDRKPIQGFFVRKEAKQHGVQKRIEGNLASGSKVIIVDDVTTTGGSVLRAVEAVQDSGSSVTKVITVVDRLEGARENLSKHGLELVALFTRDDFIQ